MNPAPNLVLVSGGLVSTALAFEMHSKGIPITCLHIGQKSTRAWEAVERVAALLERPAQCIQLLPLEDAVGTTLTTQVVPTPQLKHWSTLLCCAVMIGGPDATIFGGWSVYAGQSKEEADHSDWKQVVQTRDAELIRFRVPYLFKGADLVVGECMANYGKDALALSYSCERGGAVHCGECPACQRRKRVFRLAGALDPTEYAVADS